MTAIARADLRRMLRRRGLVLTGLLAPAGIALAIAAVAQILHVTDPAEHPTAGGASLLDLAAFVTLVSMVFGTVIGAMLGAEDVANGTLRYILLTGCSRLRLYLVRIPLVALVAIAVGVPALLILIVGAFALPHAGAPGPTGSAVWEQVLVLVVTVGVYALIAYGIGSAIHSTGGAIAVALGLNLVGLNLIGTITLVLPSAEPWLLNSAISRVTLGGDATLGVALVAIGIWVGVFLAVGLVRALRTEA